MQYEKTVLDSGLRVISSTLPNTNSVSMAIFLVAGSRYEVKEINGISHFIEHMLFKGTRKRPTSKEISEAVEGIGGLLNAETGKEVTVYWAKVPRKYLNIAADVLTDALLHSLLDPVEIEKERKVIIEELNMLTDVPQDWVHVLFDETLWGDQPLGRDIAGTRDSVSQVNRDQMLDYMVKRYVPSSAVLAVAGPLSHGEVLQMIEPMLADWRPAPEPPEVATYPPAEQVRVRLQQRKTEQAHLCVGFPGLSYVHPDRYALDLLNVVLGEGMSSRLFLEIREKRGLAYDVHSYINHYRDAGAAVVYAGVDPKQIDRTIEAALAELEKVKDGVPEQELTKAKEFWKGRLLLRLEDTRAVASWLGGQELLLGRIYTLDEVVKIIDSITDIDIKRVAKDVFAKGRVNLAVVGPFAKEERFLKLVKV
ncbi:MAG: insulinase family protein [Chloroflexi bacterium]|nr:insulinase family protein [Chloroflexota bacterium]